MFAAMGKPSSASHTGRAVPLPRISASMLLWSGERCWTRTNAMPLVAGMFSKKVLNALSPPADAPRPTINGCATDRFETGGVVRLGALAGLAPPAFLGRPLGVGG